MIGRLRGTVEVIGEDWLILDVGGVGYEISCAPRLLGKLTIGSGLTLAIETYVREDAIRLFGFTGEVERRWFRLLQSVQGVGAKSALAIIGVLTPGELANAVALGDQAQVARAPGVGPKVAARIVTELKDKAPALVMQAQSIAQADATEAVSPAVPAPDAAGEKPAKARKPRGKAVAALQDDTLAIQADATSALVNLGNTLGDASQAVALTLRDLEEAGDTPSLQGVIKGALKKLAG